MEVLLQVFCIGVIFANGTYGLENLAQNIGYRGVASQSSVHQNGWAAADKAVDGHLQGDRYDVCSFTQSLWFKTAWWKFTLTRWSNVAYLKIFFRRATVNRHVGFNVFVFNESTYIPPSTDGYKVFTQDVSSCPKQVMNVTVNRVTKGIAIFNSKVPPLNTNCTGYEPSFASIEICEIMIMGCQNHQYGENCTSCSQSCLNQECDAFNGSCIYGCSERYFDPPDCLICKGGYYGLNCEQECSKCKNGTFCHNITGICPLGCQNHWNGSKCDVCENGFYGTYCSTKCGRCKPGTYCHNVTGICQEGCNDNWDGVKCNLCKNGFYGDNCRKTCGNCKPRTHCHDETGVCLEGCDDHWNGSQCNACKSGYYGQNCDRTCGKCKSGTICDYITGICPEGCQGQWNGSNCDLCQDGFYGEDCTRTCGHCFSETFCNKITGICHKGCDVHWNGSTCNVCKNGFYGDNCTMTCGHCKAELHCHNITGICTDGCSNHWDGPQCNVCRVGFYGKRCEKPCGRCANETYCDKITGKCPEGCQDHWKGIKCDGALSPVDINAGDGVTNPSSVIISILATLLAVIVLYLGARFVHNKRKIWKIGNNQTMNIQAVSLEKPQFHNQIADHKEDHTYHEIDSSIYDYEDIHTYTNKV